MSYPHRAMLMVMLVLSTPAIADEADRGNSPSMELLEFLGEWVTDNGEWVDPDEFDEEGFADMLRLTEQEQEENESR